MKLILHDKEKIQQFLVFFRHIKEMTDFINLRFDNNRMYSQGMDNNHISLFEISLSKDWFDEYESDNLSIIGINCDLFYKALNCYNENHIITIYDDENGDKVMIDLKSEKESCHR